MILLRFASSVQSCCGEGGALQADVAVCGEHSPCSGQAARSFGGLSPGAARLFPPRRAAQAARGLCGLSLGAVRLFPPRRAARAARGLALSPRARRAPSLHGLSEPPVGSQGVLRQDLGLFAGWEGVASLGLSLPLAPPPASYLQRGWGGSSLEFLSPFILRTAGRVFWPVNFSSLSHSLKKAPSDGSQGLLAGPYPKQCRWLLSVPPPLAGGGCGRLGYFSAGSCF